MKILTTGASGFIGKRLVPILAREHKVCAFGRRRPQFEDAEFIQGDLRDFNSIKEALKGIDVIIHLGAVTAGKEAILTLDTDVKGTYNLIEAGVQEGIKKIIFASSIAAYGCLSENFVPMYLPIDEKHPCIPEDIYGLSKFLGEEILGCYTRKEGITTISLRIAAVRALAESSQASLASKCTLWSAVDVGDVIKAIVLCLDKSIEGNEVFNMAAENIWAKENSLSLIKRYYPEVKVTEEYFRNNPHAGFLTISKAKKILGFKPEYELRNYQVID